jgi:type I restriction enzyme S subunit
MSLPNISIGELESPEKGGFKIGPFGSSLKKDELVDQGIPVLGIEDVLSSRFKRPFRKYITDEKYAQLKKYTVRPGDVLVTTMGTIGRATVTPNITEPMIIDSHLFRMRLDQSLVVPTYLCYALNGFDGLLRQLEAKSRGAIMAGLNTTILKECTIPLPPLAEQQRIADILSRADRLRRLRRFALEMSEGYLQAVFLEMFGDPVTNPMGWEVVEFSDVCDSHLGKMLDGKQQTGKHLRPYLRNVNVQWGSIDLSDLQEMDFDSKDRAKYRLCSGDVLICEGGEVGRAAIWKGQTAECYFQKALHRARVKPDKTVPEFIVSLMRCLADSGGLEDSTSQVTIAHLTGEKLKLLRFPLPPLASQRKFVDVAHRTERLCAQQREALRQAEHLFQGLLQAAFRGEV